MKFSKLASTVSVAVIVAGLFFSSTFDLALAQSRRQPPTSTEKKNKRPPEPGQQPAEQKPEDPIPTDVIGKPQDAEKITITTQVVNCRCGCLSQEEPARS